MTTPWKTGWALAAAVLLAALGCGGGSEGQKDSPGDRADRAGASLQGLCPEAAGLSPDDPRGALREQFRRGHLLPDLTGVRLVLDRTVIRPGDRFHAAVANRSEREVTYGVSYRLERRGPEGWQKVPGTPDAFILIALVARPGELGPCVPLQVPERAKPGPHRVLVGSPAQPGGRGEGRLLATFDVRE